MIVLEAEPTAAMRKIINEGIAEDKETNGDPITVECEQTMFEGEIAMRIIAPTGDDRITWCRQFIDQVQDARKKFYDLLDKGYQAFVVRMDGQKTNRRMFEFNPQAEEIYMVPPVAAG